MKHDYFPYDRYMVSHECPHQADYENKYCHYRDGNNCRICNSCDTHKIQLLKHKHMEHIHKKCIAGQLSPYLWPFYMFKCPAILKANEDGNAHNKNIE